MSDSKRLFETATRLIPGGVNSPVRAFRGVGGEPFFVARGEGARIWDVAGRSYLDFLGSWGPLILGHAPAAVVEAISEAARRGTSYGAPTALEVEMAEAITAAYPSIELVRLVSSGTEAAMSAIRVARGATGRPLLSKFDGCYHGHADSLLVKAGSGGATFSIPDSGGVPAPLAALTLSAPFNDLDALRALFRARGDEIAAVIVEPVAGNMGVVAPLPGFHEGRPAGGCRAHGQPCRLDAHGVLLRRSRHRLYVGEARRHRALRPLLPRDARARCVPGALAVRGRVRLARPHRGRPRARGPGGRRCPRVVFALSAWKALTRSRGECSLHRRHSIPRRAIDCRWAQRRAWEHWGSCSSPFWSSWRSRRGAASRPAQSPRFSRSTSRTACTFRRTRSIASTATATRDARNTRACRRSSAAWPATGSRAQPCRQ